MEKRLVRLYTDGACSGNPGPGGWAAILQSGTAEKELSGGEKQTTNNRMELTGVIEGLSQLKYPCRVEIYTDSKYVADAISKGWAIKWRARGWKRTGNEPALNPDLWARLLELVEKHECEFIWVKGHAGHAENERCDALAVKQRDYFASLGN